jgi:hypothetical protein
MNYMETLNIKDEIFQKVKLKLKHGLYSKNELLMKSLRNFYDDKKNLDQFLPIVEGDAKISLRLIDWFVTNYSKGNMILVDIIFKGQKQKSNVYLDYRSQLKAYSKKLFDPFCRRERIKFNYAPDKELETTVGQLNFFKWFIEKDYLSYVREHKEEIEKNMNLSAKPQTKTKTDDSTLLQQQQPRKKRKELSVSAVKQLNKQNVKIIVDFN